MGAVFVLGFFLRIAPLLQGHTVPYGYVDTSSHIGAALDVSEGNFASLLHPWWHLKNHILVGGYDVVDRTITSFFYPPLIHLLLAASFLTLHPGIATYLVISLIFSLGTIAIFFLCRTFKFSEWQAALAAALTAFSWPLIRAQHLGFWTFPTAFTFAIFSYAFLRHRNRRATWASIVFALLSLTTHWAFFPIFFLFGAAELYYAKNTEAGFFLKCFALMNALLFALVFYFSNPWEYIPTYYNSFLAPALPLAALGAWGYISSVKKYPGIGLAAFAAFSASAMFHLFSLRFIFADMVQLSLPFFLAFFTATLVGQEKSRAAKIILVMLIAASLVSEIGSSISFFQETQPSIPNKIFDGLISLREHALADGAILAIDREIPGWWIAIVSKDAKILYPDTYEGELRNEYSQRYFSSNQQLLGNFTFTLITERDGKLLLNENATLAKEKYGWNIT